MRRKDNNDLLLRAGSKTLTECVSTLSVSFFIIGKYSAGPDKL